MYTYLSVYIPTCLLTNSLTHLLHFTCMQVETKWKANDILSIHKWYKKHIHGSHILYWFKNSILEQSASLIKQIPHPTHFSLKVTGNMFLWNVSIPLQDYSLSHPRRPQPEQSQPWNFRNFMLYNWLHMCIMWIHIRCLKTRWLVAGVPIAYIIITVQINSNFMISDIHRVNPSGC